MVKIFDETIQSLKEQVLLLTKHSAVDSIKLCLFSFFNSWVCKMWYEKNCIYSVIAMFTKKDEFAVAHKKLIRLAPGLAYF